MADEKWLPISGTQGGVDTDKFGSGRPGMDDGDPDPNVMKLGTILDARQLNEIIGALEGIIQDQGISPTEGDYGQVKGAINSWAFSGSPSLKIGASFTYASGSSLTVADGAAVAIQGTSGGSFTCARAAEFTNDVTVGGEFNASSNCNLGPTEVGGTLLAQGNTTLQGSASVGTTLSVGGATTCTGALAMNGGATLAANQSITGGANTSITSIASMSATIVTATGKMTANKYEVSTGGTPAANTLNRRSSDGALRDNTNIIHQSADGFLAPERGFVATVGPTGSPIVDTGCSVTINLGPTQTAMVTASMDGESDDAAGGGNVNFQIVVDNVAGDGPFVLGTSNPINCITDNVAEMGFRRLKFDPSVTFPGPPGSADNYTFKVRYGAQGAGNATSTNISLEVEPLTS